MAQQVAVVARDDLVWRRINACLSSHAIGLLDRAAEIEGLCEQAAQASAIVLAAGCAHSEWRMQIGAANERFPNVPIVVVVSLSTGGVHKGLEAGATGLVLDSEVEAALPETIRACSAGLVVVPHPLRHHPARPALSHRAKQTLALVAARMSNRQIAPQLFLAESTIKTHLASLVAKLGVGSRSEPAALVHDPGEKLRVTIRGLRSRTPLTGLNGNPR